MKKILTALMLTALAGSAHAYPYNHDFPAPVLDSQQRLILTWNDPCPSCDWYVKFWTDPADYGSGEVLAYIEGEAPHRYVVNNPACGYYGVLGLVLTPDGQHIAHATQRPVLVEVPCE